MDVKYNALKEFGLKENEIKVYVESLKKENLTPYQISKLTKIPRTTVYDVLMGLSLKGLVELEQTDGFKKQQTLVKAKNPSVLRSILHKRQKELIQTDLNILEILPELKEGFHRNTTNANFKFYPGLDGAKSLYFEDVQSIKVPTYEWDFLMPMDAFGMKPVNKDVEKLISKRKKQPYFDKTLIPLTDWTRHVLTYQIGRDKDYLKNNEHRFIEDNSFNIATNIRIQGDFIKMICAKEDELWGLKIKSEMLSVTLNSIFNANWRIATPLTADMVKAWGPNMLLELELAL